MSSFVVTLVTLVTVVLVVVVVVAPGVDAERRFQWMTYDGGGASFGRSNVLGGRTPEAT